MSVNGRLRDLERAVPRRMRSGCSRCDDLRRKWVWIYLVLKADLKACPECGGDVDRDGNPIGLHGERSKGIVLVIEHSAADAAGSAADADIPCTAKLDG